MDQPAQLQALLFRNALLGTTVNVLTPVLLCWLHRDTVPTTISVAWLGYMLSVVAIRTGISVSYHRAADNMTNLAWRGRFRAGLAFTCAGWLSTLFIFMPPASIAHQLGTAIVLTGMAAGGVAVLSSDRVSFTMHIFSTVFAGAFFLFAQRTELHLTFGILALIISFGLYRSANIMRTALIEAITFAAQKQQLVRELEISNRELIKAKEATEVAADAKAKFLANMSHELRTPIHGVSGFVELLKLSPLDSVQRKYVKNIEHSANALLAVINDVLDFSKIEAGRMDVVTTKTDLIMLIESSVAIITPAAQKKNIQVICEVDRDVPRIVLTDAVKVRQVLLNFLSNAIKFTEQGVVTLHASYRAEESAVTTVSSNDDNRAVAGMLTIRIQDTGIGMSADTLNKIFQPFVQGSEGTSRKYGGTGLGLVISKNLIDLMGGELSVQSEIGKGTSIQIELPIQISTP